MSERYAILVREKYLFENKLLVILFFLFVSHYFGKVLKYVYIQIVIQWMQKKIIIKEMSL